MIIIFIINFMILINFIIVLYLNTEIQILAAVHESDSQFSLIVLFDFRLDQKLTSSTLMIIIITISGVESTFGETSFSVSQEDPGDRRDGGEG